MSNFYSYYSSSLDVLVDSVIHVQSLASRALWQVAPLREAMRLRDDQLQSLRSELARLEATRDRCGLWTAHKIHGLWPVESAQNPWLRNGAAHAARGACARLRLPRSLEWRQVWPWK